MRRRSHSPLEADIERLRVLVEKGGVTTATELAERMGISQARVKGLANLAELPVEGFSKEVRYRKRAAKAKRIESIREFLEEGLNYREIGERLGITHQRVQQIVSAEPDLAPFRRRRARIRETAEV